MSVVVADIIRQALVSGNPIVALETAVLTCGLPRTLWEDAYGECPQIIDDNVPINIGLANAMTEAVVVNGAIPAWIGLLHGIVKIGLTPEELIELASDETAGKVSISSCAQSMHQNRSAGTTVATTLLACRLASKEHPIRVFATGGIGGFHRHWTQHLDVSADLTALATTPTCVVASGAKSILDVQATVESMETIGVPVLGYGHNHFPRFIEHGATDDPLVHQVDTPEEVAMICKQHWQVLGMNTAILATVHVPFEFAIEKGSLDQVIERSEHNWKKTGQPPSSRTPYLLDQLARATQGRSLVANLALLCNNAAVAGKISVALAK